MMRGGEGVFITCQKRALYSAFKAKRNEQRGPLEAFKMKQVVPIPSLLKPCRVFKEKGMGKQNPIRFSYP